MIAGFGSGAAFSLVSGMTQGNPLMGAFSTGTLFALLQGAFYQVVTQCITQHTDMQEEAAGDAVLALDARQYTQFIDSL